MKNNRTCITALFLVLLMTASLLASCSRGEREETVTEEDGIPVYDKYTTREIDLGLGEEEILLDIIEANGELRATVGIHDPLDYGGAFEGFFYPTERRWYSMDYVEDTEKREKTVAHHELTFVCDPAVDFVVGGEHYDSADSSGVQYHFYRNGVMQEEILESTVKNEFGEIIVEAEKICSPYGGMMHVMLYEDVPFLSINEGGVDMDRTVHRGATKYGEQLYINDRFLDTNAWRPGDPYYLYCGLIGIDGVPYALLEIEEKGCLVPLTPETTELPLEGTEIEGCPTGGAFSDGRFGYFMSNTELWRTDGTNSQCIADLAAHGVNLSAAVRSVRALSDGRILVSVNGKLVELSEADGTEGERKTFNIAIMDCYDDRYPEDLNLILSKYNSQSEQAYFRVKQYNDVANMNLALLTGDVAMVITQNRFILNHYVKQGALASLEEVAPALFEKDVLIENVVDATRVDGVCYYLPRVFSIWGENVTAPNLLPNGQLFATRKAYCDFISEHAPDYFDKKTPGDVLEAFAMDLDEWIDWEANTCRFDDGTFAEILEFCSQGSTDEEVMESYLQETAATQYAVTWTAGGFSLWDGVQSYRYTDVKKALERQAEIPKTEGIGSPETWVQLDFPMPSRVHDGYGILAHNLYAVAENEESREAAGDLLSWLILELKEEEFPEKEVVFFRSIATQWEGEGFYINRSETERYLRRLLNGYVDPEEEVNKMTEESKKIAVVVNIIRRQAQIHNSKCGKKQYDTTWEYIKNADHLQYTHNEIFAVLQEEAASYFAGQITAKQAADYVQNRVSLYLAEQG